MCGIAGFLDNKTSATDGHNLLDRMLTRIRYRGPDECGVFVEDGVGVGSVRLSIIDLESGQQPISNEDGSMWIAFNGEIYNYKELREVLKGLGHRFKSSSDTEVILHAYEEYGVDCLNMLNGQFAISIYNVKRKELFLARDRVGIRPLFYYRKGKSIVYASEVKSIFEYPGIERSISMKALSQIFTLWSPLSPNSTFENVFELPPGNYMLCREDDITIKQYWNLSYPEAHTTELIHFKEAKEQLYEILHDSVRLRLRADVPVAAYLSGGLDSTATTSIIRKIDSGLLNTFSIGFSDSEFDETSYQQEVANSFGTNHYHINCTNADIAEAFRNVIWHTETPLLRTSPTPMMLLSGLVREHGIKVVMTGEGADEVFAGYNVFKEALVRQFWARDKHSKYRPLLLKKLYPYLPHIRKATPAMLKMFFGYQLEDVDNPLYSHLLRWHNTSKIQQHFTDDIKKSINGSVLHGVQSVYEDELENRSLLAKAQILETKIFMSGYLLSSQGDRMGMANSVEGRYPFLDHRLLEFASRLPDSYKLKGFDEKHLLKQTMKNEIPGSVLNRSKQAYRAPIANVFMGDSAPPYISELLSESCLKESGYFNPGSVTSLMSKIRKGQNPSEVDNMALTGILSTQLIYHQFIKSFDPINRDEIYKSTKRNS